MADMFDACLDLEDQHINSGRAEGVRDGEAAGLEEGRELGESKGQEIGAEVGFYAGFSQVLREASEDSEAFGRVSKQAQALESIAKAFPLTDPQDERMQDMMVDLRGKFKAICARLGLPEQLQLAAVGLTTEVAVRPSYDF
ncbi:g2956 [Coccomyxa viridis]|uniref:G2956 protein n=1 Tax=Coccomyxa viridis TaxID=1274662 RepID=A0ABP1FLN2_9CHLO